MELKPCPFCGNERAYLNEKQAGWRKVEFVYCSQCGTEGPAVPQGQDSVAEAAMRWNKRAKKVAEFA